MDSGKGKQLLFSDQGPYVPNKQSWLWRVARLMRQDFHRVWTQFDKLLCTFLIMVGLAVMLFLVTQGIQDNTLLEWIKTFVSTITGYLGGLITGREHQRRTDTTASTRTGDIKINGGNGNGGNGNGGNGGKP